MTLNEIETAVNEIANQKESINRNRRKMTKTLNEITEAVRNTNDNVSAILCN